MSWPSTRQAISQRFEPQRRRDAERRTAEKKDRDRGGTGPASDCRASPPSLLPSLRFFSLRLCASAVQTLLVRSRFPRTTDTAPPGGNPFAPPDRPCIQGGTVYNRYG